MVKGDWAGLGCVELCDIVFRTWARVHIQAQAQAQAQEI